VIALNVDQQRTEGRPFRYARDRPTEDLKHCLRSFIYLGYSLQLNCWMRWAMHVSIDHRTL